MNIAKTSIRIAGVVTAFAAVGCAATDSVGFRHMTAADHEVAARSGQDATGATPAEHLAAAQALRAAETSACAEIPDAERDMGPFLHHERIVAVEEVDDRVFPKAPLRPFGIAVTIRATPGVTEQWLGRVIQCHVAHYEVVGTTGTTSPLLTQGARIAVSSTSVGFKVSITTADSDKAQTIIEKGHALTTNAS
jgi:hypothetical protein